MSIIYPKNLKETEKLSAFFGETYGEEFEKIIAREPRFTYMAYLTQAGADAPVAQVLFSNFDTDPVFAYEASGTYNMLHPMINSTNCIVTISSGQNTAPETYRAAAFVRMEGKINIVTLDFVGNAMDDILLNTMVKLEIW